MTIHFIFGGGKHAKEYADLVASYEERLTRYFPIEIELFQSKLGDPSSVKKEEGEKILKRIERCDLVILFDERGKELSSERFSALLARGIDEGKKHIGIIVGGAYGVDERIRERADHAISFSPMIFPHQLARAMAMEQVYRALDIRAGGKYHHE